MYIKIHRKWLNLIFILYLLDIVLYISNGVMIDDDTPTNSMNLEKKNQSTSEYKLSTFEPGLNETLDDDNYNYEIESMLEGSSEEQLSEGQVLEACISLRESFEKECHNITLEIPLAYLVSECRNFSPNISRVKEISNKIVSAQTDLDITDMHECNTMVVSTALFLFSDNIKRGSDTRTNSMFIYEDSIYEDEDNGSLSLESLDIHASPEVEK
ncbi:uncharacterized protein CMU_033360 [Cryptosporidium muris RN66]|uniref:Uncharacterized protein n=1 Tax=Cryptosporidium muris (strain RN66) TaxID=441375 RepID=B6AFG0_CRYMR|nr:uncharacterized protein CMU_033360 [Cryptosporidium muris RN66]EEA06951.1 hypothetical protein CMU_033360 [Cryptosporidium muris RN66]|eukprot:XP_002141300.1 hypothetical protein [Cryptosporidium muris RN66]